MDYVVKGVTIGGFALVAAPAEYGVPGSENFHRQSGRAGYEKDFGPVSLNEFKRMARFNPDRSWSPFQNKERILSCKIGGSGKLVGPGFKWRSSRKGPPR